MSAEHSRSPRTRHSHLPGRLRPLERRPGQPATTLPAWEKVIRVIGFSAPEEILDPTQPYRHVLKEYFDAKTTATRGLGEERMDAFKKTYTAELDEPPTIDQVRMRQAYQRVTGYISMIDSRFPAQQPSQATKKS